jgi:hypothetical protein
VVEWVGVENSGDALVEGREADVEYAIDAVEEQPQVYDSELCAWQRNWLVRATRESGTGKRTMTWRCWDQVDGPKLRPGVRLRSSVTLTECGENS